MKLSVVLILTSLLSGKAFGWGATGHRVVGHVAQQYLTTNTLRKIYQLMEGETLARSSTWADEVRSDPNREYYDRLLPWHYVEIPVGETYETSEHAEAGDVLTAMAEMERTLRDASKDLSEKQEALRLLVHFMGDVHQPLHVGNGLDRGANSCYVSFFGEQMKLHAVWDSGIIDHMKLSYTELANFLIDDFHTHLSQVEKLLLVDVDYQTMAQESQNIRPSLYPESPEEPGEHSILNRSYCTNDRSVVSSLQLPSLSYSYVYKMRPVVERQLYLAGIRLAAKLNQIFQ